MSRTPSAKTITKAAFVLVPVVLIGGWFWRLQRDWTFIGAVRQGNYSKVRAGLDGGIDPNKANMKGVTGLRFVTNNRKPGQDAMIRLLLDRGANPNDGLYFAAASQPLEIVRLLLDKGARPTDGLCSAVNAQRPGVVQLLISRGANVNVACSGTGTSVLLSAAELRNNKIIYLLKAAGAKK